jgi:hypothetical protein
MEVSEPLVVEPKQMQDCCVEVVGVDRVHDGFKSNLISCAMRVPSPNGGSGKEGGKCPAVVLTPLVVS